MKTSYNVQKNLPEAYQSTVTAVRNEKLDLQESFEKLEQHYLNLVYVTQEDMESSYGDAGLLHYN